MSFGTDDGLFDEVAAEETGPDFVDVVDRDEIQDSFRAAIPDKLDRNLRACLRCW